MSFYIAGPELVWFGSILLLALSTGAFTVTVGYVREGRRRAREHWQRAEDRWREVAIERANLLADHASCIAELARQMPDAEGEPEGYGITSLTADRAVSHVDHVEPDAVLDIRRLNIRCTCGCALGEHDDPRADPKRPCRSTDPRCTCVEFVAAEAITEDPECPPGTLYYLNPAFIDHPNVGRFTEKKNPLPVDMTKPHRDDIIPDDRPEDPDAPHT